MRHFFSKRVRTVLIASVVLAILLTVAGNLLGYNLPGMVVKGILTPFRSAGSSLTNQAEQLYDYMFKYDSLAAENERLREELAQTKEDARTADAVSRENDLLRAAMGLKESNPSWQLVDGYVISRSSQDWSSSFTIDQGSNAGIEAGMCVITANGEVVGLVSEVGPNYAVVKTLLDSSLEISSTISSSGFNGIVQGGYATGKDGLLRMNYLPSSSVIRNNDQVVTSGSTVYPRNLVVGYVVDAGFDNTGVAKYALLKPAVNVGSLEMVFIVTEYDAG